MWSEHQLIRRADARSPTRRARRAGGQPLELLGEMRNPCQLPRRDLNLEIGPT